ncbi:chaperone protein ClpB 1, partial [Trifolium medium]|nr:chaperone protein ClpB 1 [Trifolium medium]
MRSGIYTLQETLTAESASILKHSLGLARRRNHAQITPLHVATTLLSLNASSLKKACLKSQQQNINHNHPLQCRALELCFNVALNRLPTSMIQHQHVFVPSLSNALIAALKRAQAHQRRGCIEQNQNQNQQPLLSVKVELDQLILSILDDPSVSRVMREAGFSSTSVKNNLEHENHHSSSLTNHNNHFLSSYGYGNYGYGFGSVLFSKPSQVYNHFPLQSCKEDVKLVFDVLLRKKKRNIVIVSDTVSLTEGLVNELMEKFERDEVPNELKKTHFVKFNLGSISLKYMKKEEVEMNVLRVLKKKVSDYVALGVGAVFYVGDLKWLVDGDYGDESCYNHVDYLVDEIGKLFCGEEINN